MMKPTTEFRKENIDFLEKLKIADAVICMDRSKVKDTCIDNNICNYLQKYYFADIYNMVREYNMSAYLLSYGFRPNVIDIYDSYYDSIYIGSYEDIKNCLNNESNMEYFKLPIIIDELNVTAYFNKNKYEVNVFFHYDNKDNFLYGIWNPNNENERFITIVFNRNLDELIKQIYINNERNFTLEKALIKLNGRIGYVKSLYERSHFEDFEIKMKVVETLKKLNISLK